MPPKKRHAATFKLGLGFLEVFLMERVSSIAGGAQSDHIRLAIRNYAKMHPGLQPMYLETAAANFAEREIESPEVRDRFLAEVHRYLTLPPEHIKSRDGSADGLGLPRLSKAVQELYDDELED